MHRRFALDVSQFVDAVVRQLQVPQLLLRVSLVDPLDAALEEIGPSAAGITLGPAGASPASEAASVTTCSFSWAIKARARANSAGRAHGARPAPACATARSSGGWRTPA